MVTHLPQVAAFADRHLVVRKAEDGAVTRSGVVALDDAGRVRELSRMLAGQEDSGHRRGARRGAARRRPGGARRRTLTRRSTSRSRTRRATSHPSHPSHGSIRVMRLATLRRSRSEPPLPGLHGPARVERRAAALARRARPGDIAVLEHLDLDGTSARMLLDAGVAAVVNAAPSISGRYPNLGPQLLVQAGIPVLDQVGPEVIRLLDDGDRLRLDGDALYRGDELVCRGDLLTAELGRCGHGGRPGPASERSWRPSRTPPPST